VLKSLAGRSVTVEDGGRNPLHLQEYLRSNIATVLGFGHMSPLAAIRCRVLPHPRGDGGIVAASIGVATQTLAMLAASAADLVQRADGALYDAKAGGRNRAVAAPP
jgi:GGDEF domain-containing protein